MSDHVYFASAILFDAVDNLARRWKYTLQIGSDDRIQRSALFPTHGFRLFVQQAKLGTAIGKCRCKVDQTYVR
jgi:hypothetical protein